ncbi:MAG: DNA-processing protein DprA [Burkholderiaceae bacterium]
MEREELSAWLRLVLTPGVGNDTARQLLSTFGLPQTVFEQSSTALSQVATPAQVFSLRGEPAELAQQLETTWRWLHDAAPGDAPRRVVVLGDPLYPESLLSIEDPPLMLYLLGRIQALPNHLSRSVAIVGSRNPTPQGAANARHFAKALQQAGITVVSGLALGIDGAAHEGALDAASSDESRLTTIAVVGTGLDRVYPKDHKTLAHRIAQSGLIVSEYLLGTPPLAANFPRRNRLIAGLSCATLVVEAALKSGSLITARLAAEQGKEVFAIPGSIHSTQSHGCHALIKQGAKLVEVAQDILEELSSTIARQYPLDPQPIDQPTTAPHPLTSADKDLLKSLGFDPVGLDVLMARTGLDPASLQAQLMALELQGQVARLPGALFQRQSRV